jgi:hypothetical protein
MKSFRSFFFSLAVLATFIACVPARAQFIMGNFKAAPMVAATAVTQATNRTTGVTLNAAAGKITTSTASLAAGASASFTVTNSFVAIGDIPTVAIRSGATNKETSVRVTAVAAGSFEITVFNQHASTAEVGAIVINVGVQKAVLN